MSKDFILRGSLSQTDPELNQLLNHETQRQDSTIILIASESDAPQAVREAMSSTFGNIYAEGYPREAGRRQTEEQIFDVAMELAYYRRNSDPRYYKGVEYADVLEALTRRRAAELFAKRVMVFGEHCWTVPEHESFLLWYHRGCWRRSRRAGGRRAVVCVAPMRGGCS